MKKIIIILSCLFLFIFIQSQDKPKKVKSVTTIYKQNKDSTIYQVVKGAETYWQVYKNDTVKKVVTTYILDKKPKK